MFKNRRVQKRYILMTKVPDVMKGDFRKILDPFPVYKQETDHTCGPASMRMALEFLGNAQPEHRLAMHALTLPTGALHLPMLWAYRRFLKPLGLSVVMSQDDPDVYEKIKAALADGLPTMIIFSVIDEFHPPNKVMHYAVVMGLDEPAGVIHLANPFGHMQKMPIGEWWDRFSHAPEHASMLTKLLLFTRLLKTKTCFLLSRKS